MGLIRYRAGRRIAVVLAALLLAGCSAAPAADNLPLQEQPKAAQESPAREAASEDGDGLASGEGAADVEPVASLPAHGIYLYPGEPEGAVLRVGETEQALNWIVSTPRAIMPVLQMHDYDRDGEDELAVVLHVGSGTGLAIEELHMVELAGADESNGRPFADHLFLEEDYLAQLRDALEFALADKDGELYGQVTVGGQSHEIGLRQFRQDFGADSIREELGFGAIVYFKAEAGELALSAAIGLRIDGVAEPQYFGTVEASVSYASGRFELGDFRFAAD